MDYYFCGADLNCWGEWLFVKSSGAAWVQAFFSLLAIAFTLLMWRHDRQTRSFQEEERYQRNMAYAKTAFALCSASLGRLEGNLKARQFMATRRTIESMEGALLDAVKVGLPNADMMAYVYAMIARLSEIIQFLEIGPPTLERAQAYSDSRTRDKTIQDLREQIRTFSSNMDKAYDAIQGFQEKYLKDPLAAWEEQGATEATKTQAGKAPNE